MLIQWKGNEYFEIMKITWYANILQWIWEIDVVDISGFWSNLDSSKAK